MKEFKKIIIITLIIILWKTVAFSQVHDYSRGLIESLFNFKRAGQSAMPFLKLGAGARAMAMGGAVNSLKGDPSALFYNPAGLAYAENKQVMFSYMNWLLDTKIMASAASIDMNNLGVFGLSFLYYDYGAPIIATQIDATQENGYSILGKMNPTEFFVGFGYGRQISDKFALGGQVKIAHQDLLGSGGVKTRTASRTSTGEWVQQSKDAKKTVVAFDFGTIYDTGWRGLSFSMAFRNFGKEIKYEREKFDLPLSFRFGIAVNMMELMKLNSKEHSVIIGIDRIHSRDWSEQMNFGVEYGFLRMIYLRAGYKYNYSSEGLTLGSGFNWKWHSSEINVDYAFKHSAFTLDNVHVMSVNYSF
ncbi:MAG: PorV/PorQ family protein [Nitrospiraceae bacterium]|nr:PorV/PorQ family protein [Nitrospiraceae bacterium]